MDAVSVLRISSMGINYRVILFINLSDYSISQLCLDVVDIYRLSGWFFCYCSFHLNRSAERHAALSPAGLPVPGVGNYIPMPS